MKQKLAYLALTITTAFIPFLMSTLLLGIVYQANFQGIHPQLPNENQATYPELADEVFHWRQAISFYAAGFDSGYYTLNEVPARAEFIHFHAWGPFPSILYGTFAHLFGTGFDLFIKVNTLLFAIAVFTLVYFAKPNIKQLILLSILFAFFPTMLLFFPTFMLQTINLILAVFVAAICYVVMQKGSEITYTELGVLLLFLFGISLFRFTWSFFFLPILIYVGTEKHAVMGQRLGFIISFVLIIFCFGIFVFLSAPYPNILSNIIVKGFDIPGIVVIMSRHIFVNFVAYFIGGMLFISIRLPILIILNIYIFPYYEKFRGRPVHISPLTQIETLFVLSNLGLVWVFNIVIYSVEAMRDIRLLAPHLLVAIILLILYKHYRLSIILLAIFVIAFPFALNTYRSWTGLHFGKLDDAMVASYQAEYNTYGVMYNSDTDNAWCNTILFDVNYNEHADRLLALDDRLGLSFFFRAYHIKSELKSQYLIMPTTVEPLETWNLQPLLPVENGYIYLNLDADCDSSE